MTIRLIIMMRACCIRMQRGETLEDILSSYPALTEDDKSQIRSGTMPKEVLPYAGD